MKLLAVETSTEACSAALYIDGIINERFELAPKEHTKLILPMIDSLMSAAGLKPQQLDALAFSCGPGSFTGVRIATGVIHGIAFGADLLVVPVSTLAAIAQDFFDNNSKAQAKLSTILNTATDSGFCPPLPSGEACPEPFDLALRQSSGGTSGQACRRGEGEGLQKNANPDRPQCINVAFTAMDARMGEIFWGVYQRNEQGFAELMGKESVTPAAGVEFPDMTGVGVGSGWGVYSQELMTRLAGRVSYCVIDNLPRARAIARLGVRGFEQGLAVAVEQAMPVYLRDKVAKKESER
jgi:tRNA threonylcarbamoyl adenosine modification protein YeaZ